MQIRHANTDDIEEIMEIYGFARGVMRKSGNMDQWKGGYPSLEQVKDDMAGGHLYVLESEKGIEVVFFYKTGIDPTYVKIYEGQWQNDEPYAVIHRIASSGKTRGAAAHCFDWVNARNRNLRIDTHHDNKIMQHVLEKNGFVRCGIIYLANGDPRIAFHRVNEQLSIEA